MSLTITATRKPLRLLRMWFSRVVFPAPRKPERTVTGSLVIRRELKARRALLQVICNRAPLCGGAFERITRRGQQAGSAGCRLGYQTFGLPSGGKVGKQTPSFAGDRHLLFLLGFRVVWRAGTSSLVGQIFVQNSILPSEIPVNDVRRPER
jgi:hypothetical protein